MKTVEGIPLVPSPSRELLNERQLLDYETHREEILQWLLAFGKHPDRAEGYSSSTIENDAYRLDKFYRWVWQHHEDSYTTTITTEHADEYLKQLAYDDTSNNHKSNCLKALKRLFKWKRHERGGEDWEPDFTFNTGNSANKPRDYLTKHERSRIREAALEYGSIPAYNDLSPEERDKWKAYLAQRFDKPKSEVKPDDWKRANGWKVPSIVWVSLDAGLRPVEVERAVTSWVDIENQVLRIPKEQSSKNRENWIVGLQEKTATMLDRWLTEREQYPKYTHTDKLWLTRQGNPYQSQSLRYILKRLCEIAEIPVENRQMSWYAIRHSVGTYMTREEDLAAAQAQLRHQSEQTTMKYDRTPVEDRMDALYRMG
ncbi:tyrosine-type recombinase/integrase [Halomicrococcus sp. SG-WS-1]|uniref:tyrosine-type recombinase/integrase n=1 Tax=Halomicrococcus sp. SG-WS-1 TaxID=3439057 RepID=UPI003F7AB206